MSEDQTPRVLVSACLAGEPCRYDGRANTHPAVVRLAEQGRAVLVCPEVLGGLPTPREPMELCGGRVLGASGADATDAFRKGAQLALAVARQHGCTQAILKARSPSCGVGQVYDGSFTRRLVPGDGVLAALLKAQGIAVCTEETLG
jgi:D-alanine-D-alanine ligase